MGFYIRKAISVGPFRFNLSKSGVNVSAGVKGLRFGTGPRGNYIHMGRDGLYYRKTLPARDNSLSNHGDNEPTLSTEHEPLQEIESADISQMVDSSSAELVSELNKNKNKMRIWPFVATLGALMTFILYHSEGLSFVTVIVAIGAIATTTYSVIRDNVRKSTVLFYELDERTESLYQKLHDTFDKLSSCSRKWHIEAEGAVQDRKRNAGASKVISRKAISLSKGEPPYVKTNVSVPYIPAGKQTLYFLPDKLVIFEPKGVGAIDYENLHIQIEPTRFIEEEKVPRDSEIVDTTWRYVNKSGGPDKRFNDNKQIPIVLYEDLFFTSDTGLNELIEVSKVGLGDDFVEAIANLANPV